MSRLLTSDLLVQIALVIGAVVLLAAALKLAVGVLAFLAPVLVLAFVAYAAWRLVQKVQARRM